MVGAAKAWTWPFSRSELTAGLRRYLASSSLRLLEIKEIPLPAIMPGAGLNEAGTKLSALAVGVRIDAVEHNLPLLLKEPPVSSNGRVLRAVGQREYGVYRRLAQHLPLLVPGLVLGDEQEGWLVLEVLTDLRPATEWLREDYEEAVTNMVRMHDRFYGLSQDLANYPWLARPFAEDYDDTVNAAVDAAQQLAAGAHLPWLRNPRYIDLLQRLSAAMGCIAEPLRAQTSTLIHGDYWPGNIARPVDGRQIVFDWQLAGIGPAILDLIWYVKTTELYLRPAMSIDDMTRHYRYCAGQFYKPGWSDEDFALLSDHALLWLVYGALVRATCHDVPGKLCTHGRTLPGRLAGPG